MNVARIFPQAKSVGRSGADKTISNERDWWVVGFDKYESTGELLEKYRPGDVGSKAKFHLEYREHQGTLESAARLVLYTALGAAALAAPAIIGDAVLISGSFLTGSSGPLLTLTPAAAAVGAVGGALISLTDQEEDCHATVGGELMAGQDGLVFVHGAGHEIPLQLPDARQQLREAALCVHARDALTDPSVAAAQLAQQRTSGSP